MHVYIRRKNNRMEEVDGNDKNKKGKKLVNEANAIWSLTLILRVLWCDMMHFFLPINLLDQCFRKNWIDIVERIIEWKKKKEKKV